MKKQRSQKITQIHKSIEKKKVERNHMRKRKIQQNKQNEDNLILLRQVKMTVYQTTWKDKNIQKHRMKF